MTKRTAQDWEMIFSRQRESGLTQKQFCEREKISHSAFNSARQRASRRNRGLSSTRSRRRAVNDSSAAVEMVIPKGGSLGSGRFIPVELVSGEAIPELAKPDLTVELPYGVTLRFHGLGQ